jgi:hypothetical protein
MSAKSLCDRTAVPAASLVDVPARNSVRAKWRAISRASRSSMARASSYASRSRCGGT